ncbi:NAD(P)-dependent oxidoreductase [Pseudomonas sp. SWRI51]|uniref:NAD-dependent epimerase/dehydratase family protein n=1 Tax=Pseudomonas TaxID=286 RepID=UPI00164874D3|nr:NAD(P)-dependent oxidoreductase [Pseudomonas sp. SWRI51]MBC3413910.1 NAD(P)-dependent oxidoreductase [Pseudomonas sp. SWRI51]
MGLPGKVLVTGATGFVGQHLVAALLAEGVQVRAVARSLARARTLPWFDQVEFVAADIHGEGLDVQALTEGVDALVHLAWSGLPNYQQAFHYEVNLPADLQFIKRVVAAGVVQVMVTGTCFEYGLRNGPQSETDPAQPGTAYGLAKNTLRLFLEHLRQETPFTLQWVRLFYLYGPGQAANSLLASLDRAIDEGHTHFAMSAGEQLRDYLPVEQVASHLRAILAQREFSGLVNCCSGEPVSVRALVERHLARRSSKLTLQLGHYPYSAHEPMAFWGNPERLQQLTGERHGA